MSKKTKKREKKRIRHIKAKETHEKGKKEIVKLQQNIEFPRKIRIGYISDAMCDCPEADFLPVFFAAADRYNFTTIGISLAATDGVTTIFKDGAAEWLDISDMDEATAISAVKALQLDFLVDVSVEPSPILMAIKEAGVATVTDTLTTWCYTPFDKNKLYSVTAPSLYNGYPTIGIIGSFFASEVLWPDLLAFLQDNPDCRLLLHGVDATLCQDDSVAENLRNLDLGDRILVSMQEEYPYDEVDVLLGMSGMRSYTLCRAYNHSLPVLIYTPYMEVEPFMTAIVEAVGEQDLCMASSGGLTTKLKALLEDKEKLTWEHRTLRYRFQSSSIFDLDAYIMGLECSYLTRFYAGYGEYSASDLIKLATHARENKDWEQAIAFLTIASVDAKTFPKKEILNLAWCYYFAKDPIRALYWARQAEKQGKEKIITALYLQAEILSKADRYGEAQEAVEKAFAREQKGEKMLPEIKATLMPLRAGLAYKVGRAETSDLYWEAYKNARDLPNRCLCYSAWLMSHNPKETSRQDLYEKHLGYEKIFKDVKQYVHKSSVHVHKKLRIGYISPDFRAHVMSHFMWPFLASYNHDEFEVYVYSIGSTDKYTETFMTLVDKWQNMQGIEYGDIAAKIYADKVDILFDLAGHTSNSGLPVLAYKPAPVQISGLGYMATTGLSAVDYFLTDKYVDPPELNEAYFVEKLLRLTTQFCYTGADNLPASAYAPCRDKGYVVFGVFNHLSKYTQEMVLAWKEILRRVPQGKLLLKCNPLTDIRTTAELYGRWEKMGMPMDRIIFEPSSADYMKRYLDVDIALDTYPYPGGGTTCDALYMGVPVISRYGERHSSRFSYSILCNLGLTELTAATTAEYIDKAVALANDPDLLDIFHERLRPLMKASTLMDVQGYIAEVEKIYKDIWQDYKASVGEKDG